MPLPGSTCAVNIGHGSPPHRAGGSETATPREVYPSPAAKSSASPLTPLGPSVDPLYGPVGWCASVPGPSPAVIFMMVRSLTLAQMVTPCVLGSSSKFWFFIFLYVFLLLGFRCSFLCIFGSYLVIPNFGVFSLAMHSCAFWRGKSFVLSQEIQICFSWKHRFAFCFSKRKTKNYASLRNHIFTSCETIHLFPYCASKKNVLPEEAHICFREDVKTNMCLSKKIKNRNVLLGFGFFFCFSLFIFCCQYFTFSFFTRYAF